MIGTAKIEFIDGTVVEMEVDGRDLARCLMDEGPIGAKLQIYGRITKFTRLTNAENKPLHPQPK